MMGCKGFGEISPSGPGTKFTYVPACANVAPHRPFEFKMPPPGIIRYRLRTASHSHIRKSSISQAYAPNRRFTIEILFPSKQKAAVDVIPAEISAKFKKIVSEFANTVKTIA